MRKVSLNNQVIKTKIKDIFYFLYVIYLDLNLIFKRILKTSVDKLHRNKQLIIKKYQREYKINEFVETGTYFGDMLRAQHNQFKKLYSVELDDELFNIVKKRFKKYNNIFLFKGDSKEKISEILDLINGPTIFFLDSHYSYGITAHGNLKTPILDEIKEIINKSKFKHIILIDDLFCFVEGASGYPSISDVSMCVESLTNEYSIIFSDDLIQIIPKS